MSNPDQRRTTWMTAVGRILRAHWGAIAVVLSCTALLVATLRPMAQPASHEMYSRGDCAACHDQAPTYHDDAQWASNHGRTDDDHVGRCASCHARSACVGCHTTAPPSHTSAFRSPQARGAAEAQHVYVARSEPAACLTCHAQAASDCGSCHDFSEITKWSKKARANLARWDDLLGERP